LEPNLEVIPAVDIRQGKCVRLTQGKADAETVYYQKPLDAALFWQKELGAERIHFVDLDGAMGTGDNSKIISEMTKKGANIFLSGAYIGSEFGEEKDSLTSDFVRKNLHFSWRTGHASKGGGFYATDYTRKWLKGNWNFNVDFNPEIYSVEAPDGIEPAGPNAFCALRYGENNVSAGIFYKGKYRVVAMGIPFETILDDPGKNALMKQIIHFFEFK
jgi:hypothetical protein